MDLTISQSAGGAAFVAAALLMSGCTSVSDEIRTGPAGGGNSSPVNAGTTPPALGSSGTGTATVVSKIPALPLDGYRRSPRDWALLGKASSRQLDVCMASFGFAPGPASSDESVQVAADAEARSRLYGVSDAELVRTYGYGLSTQGKRDIPHQEISDAEAFVLTGNKKGQAPSNAPVSPGDAGGKTIPPGGCAGQARLKIYGTTSSQDPFTLAGTLATEAWQRSRSDPRVAKVNADWATCMASKGYTYPDPLAAAGAFARNGGITPPAKEVQTAVADVSCKEQTHLVSVWHDVNAEYEQKAIEANQLALNEQKKQLQEALTKAAAAVNG